MHGPITTFSRCLLGACALAAGATVLAQTYPTKPVRWIVPFAAGGPTDVLSRAIASPLASSLGQPVIVENRASAAAIAGTEAAAKSVPDGYTLLTTTQGTMVFQKLLYRKLPFDPQRDLAPVSMIAKSVVALFAYESVPAKSLKELIAYAKANPGKLNYASAGIGQPFHLAMERFNQLTGTKMVHVPYKGAAQFFPDFFAGRIDMIFYPAIDQLVRQVKAGKLRALAAATEQRIPTLPDVPTFAELGMPDFVLSGWIAVVVPAATPKDIVARLNREIVKAVATPAVTKFYGDINMIPATGSPEELTRLIHSDREKWSGLITSLGITAD